MHMSLGNPPLGRFVQLHTLQRRRCMTGSREYKSVGMKKPGGRIGHRSTKFRGRGDNRNGQHPSRRGATDHNSERPMATA